MASELQGRRVAILAAVGAELDREVVIDGIFTLGHGPDEVARRVSSTVPGT